VRLLILGLSSLVQRRVLPALRGLPGVEQIDVATRRAAGDKASVAWTDGEVYADYHEALRQSSADLVYVSLVNSAHQPWTEEALRHDRHVVVDKPAFLGFEQTERMLELAAERGLCLAEATVFGYHPQVELIKQQFRGADGTPCRLTTTFSIPPMDPGNFRYQKELGGGVLWDLGPYAVSIGRLFLGDDPTSVTCHVLAHHDAVGVETAFAMLAAYPGGRSVVGTFGFDTVYRNQLDLISGEVGVDVDRIFTTPPDVANELRISRRDGTSTLAAPPGDAFAAFFDHVMQRIAVRDWAQLTSDLHRDARTLHRLRGAAGVE
jgi:predicted dehydrogenase